MCRCARCGASASPTPRLAVATCATLRLKLLKIAAWVRVSVRRVKIAMASTHPCQNEFRIAHARLSAAAA